MTGRALDRSPQTYARIGGILYLFVMVAALFGEAFVRGRLIVPGDAIATANNIVGAEKLFRVGLAAEMLTCVCDVALALILYVLLKPIHRNLSLLAAFFRLTFVAFYSVSKLFEIAALAALGRADYLKAFERQQLHALAYLSLTIHDYGYGASLLFFGVCTALFGYLVHKSGYLPTVIGVLMVIAGVGYAVYSLAQIVSPAFTSRALFPWLLLPGFFAELGLCLWLMVKGVNLPKWEERTSPPTAHILSTSVQ